VNSNLSRRAQKILAAVVMSYIKTADPVGSRTISKASGINVSPATVRNVMSDLEDQGLLHQPHTSAGRVPTTSGLRFYIDSILEVRELDTEAKFRLNQALDNEPTDDINEVMKATGKALSSLSQQVAVVATPAPEQEVLRRMEFVLLKPGLVLVVFVAARGGAHNRIVEADPKLNQEELDKYSNYLNDILSDLTLKEVKDRVAQEMAQEKVRFDSILSRALKLGQKALETGAQGELLVQGQTNLMGLPEFSDIARLKQVFEAFEEKSNLLHLLEKSLAAQGVQIFIGAESELVELDGLTAVTSPYGDGDTPLGALGVVGPTRMDYSKIIPIVDYTAKLVSRILDQRG
jgi:heat-inducible transcriptional repressor